MIYYSFEDGTASSRICLTECVKFKLISLRMLARVRESLVGYKSVDVLNTLTMYGKGV
jgi:hypothetical protein